MFKIETGFTAKTVNKYHRGDTKKTLKIMKPGESFLVRGEYPTSWNFYAQAHAMGKKIAINKVPGTRQRRVFMLSR